jgi:hypothetical protein
MNMPSWAAVIERLVAFLSGIATILGLFSDRWKSKKDLRWELVATDIPDPKEDFSGMLTLAFDGKAVTDITKIRLLIRNVGSEPIEINDFITDLTVSIDCGEVLWRSEPQSNDTAIKPKVKEGGEKATFEIERLALNSGNEVWVYFLVSGYEEIYIRGQISGITRIRRKIPTATLFSIYSALVAIAFVIIWFLCINWAVDHAQYLMQFAKTESGRRLATKVLQYEYPAYFVGAGAALGYALLWFKFGRDNRV